MYEGSHHLKQDHYEYLFVLLLCNLLSEFDLGCLSMYLAPAGVSVLSLCCEPTAAANLEYVQH